MDYHQNAEPTIHSLGQLARRVLHQGCTLKTASGCFPAHSGRYPDLDFANGFTHPSRSARLTGFEENLGSRL